MLPTSRTATPRIRRPESVRLALLPNGYTLVCDGHGSATRQWSILRPGWMAAVRTDEERIQQLWWLRVRRFRVEVPDVILADAIAWASACN